jgi:hypothetical protein
MDFSTGILIVLIAFALGRVVANGISEERERSRVREIEGMNRQQREERLNKLFGR